MKHSHFKGHIDKNDLDRLRTEFFEGLAEDHLERLENALRYALEVQDDIDPRPSAVDVALILKHLGVDAETLTATLLSDPRLRDTLDEQHIRKDFGDTIAKLVGHIHWLNTFKECTEEEPQAPEQAETLRRMLLATVDDVRAVLIKLAYRVQRLRGLPQEASAVRRCIARETMDIYTALANRLGVAQLKWEMEDLSFRHLEPEDYKDLARSMDTNRAEREAYIDAFVARLLDLFHDADINARIYGRPKHLYSIWRKMKRKQVQLYELADLLAVRVVVESVPQCYLALGLVHSLWKHLPEEFDDYIANPKENGYQSLHTAVIGPDGRVVEVQIRTKEMHEFAEHGVAAHWRYKEGSKQDQAMENMINALRRLLDNRDDDDETLLDDLNADLFSDRVFVLTPKGRVLDLPRGATPLDFAYAIHTEVGHRSRGARVDGHIVPLNYQLKSGERVEILTTKESHPSRDWMDARMGYLASSRARTKVRRWFKLQDYDLNVHDGREILDRELSHLGLGHIDLDELARHFNLVQGDDLLAALGSADISAGQLASALKVPTLPEPGLLLGRRYKEREAEYTDDITIQGVGNLMTSIGNCCKPVPGDPIIGYITQGKGVTIHRQDCPNILNMPLKRKRRLVEVSWGGTPHRSAVAVHIEAFDRQGLLRDITQVLSTARVNVLGANTRTDTKDQSVHMDLTIEVTDTGQLSLVLDRIAALPNVFEARRSE